MSEIGEAQLFSFAIPRFETDKIRLLIDTDQKVYVEKTVIQVPPFMRTHVGGYDLVRRTGI